MQGTDISIHYNRVLTLCSDKGYNGVPVVAKGTGDIEQGYRNDSKYSDR